MKKLWLGVGLALAFGACKPKKEDRATVCETAKSVFQEGMKTALAGKSLTPGQRPMADRLLANADKNFTSYCMALSEADMDCISHFQERHSEPSCAHVQA